MSERQSVSVYVDLQAPIWRVYQNWRHLERFPSFVPSVREARWQGKERLYWREEHEGRIYESLFQVMLHPSLNSLSWQSLKGPESAGRARCEPQPGGKTRLTLTIFFTPDQKSQTSEAVRVRHELFLSSFKDFVESRLKAQSETPGAGNQKPSEALA